MANLKDTSINTTTSINIPYGTTEQRPTSVEGMIRFNTTTSSLEYYNGTRWIGSILNGSTQELAAPSAQYIKQVTGTNTDGVYWINLPIVGPTQVYCIMNSAYDGGGWMMAMKATRGTTFNYSASYWTTANTLNPTAINRNDGDAKFDVYNYYYGNSVMAIFPDIGDGGSLPGLGAWTWLQPNYSRYVSKEYATLLNLFSTVNRAFIQDAKQFRGWASGVFSSQTDVRFYGFNYYNNQSPYTRTRWGFGWNENGGGLFPNGDMGSDDVIGGIGLYGNQQNTGATYSAGDYIGCCQDTTGINRSARVEIYVR